MYRRTRFAQAALVLLASTASASAQVPEDVREALQRSSAATVRGQVWARAAGPMRAMSDVSEEFYVTVALRAMSIHLCGLAPAPGQALLAAIEGWRRVAVKAHGRNLEVVLQAPLQKPTCQVVQQPAATVSGPLDPPASVPGASPGTGAAAALSTDPPARASDITVRIYGLEP